MKVLILGVDGMIGHKIAQSLISNFHVVGSTRKNINLKKVSLDGLQIFQKDFLKDDISNSEFINQQFPYEIENWVINNKKRFIHFSTDCVFSGKKGNYLDNDIPDADDLYGKTKGKGEINSNATITIRSSMIGREVYNHTELFEWLYSMSNSSIEGYSNVMYSGVTTVWMGKVINKLLSENIILNGIYNVASKPISKYELLSKLSNAFNLNVNIIPNPNIKSNKVLISKKFTEITGLKTPNWNDLISEFKEDCETYSDIYINNIL